jgi:chemotaxis protein methyltransferase CheR
MSGSSRGSSRGARPQPLTPAEFGWVRRVAKQSAGLHIAREKQKVVAARLAPLLRESGAPDFRTLIERAAADASGQTLWSMIDAITVNRTEFFREPAHFPLFQSALLQLSEQHHEVSIWSAGCASGEEPYTLAMLAHHVGLEERGRVRILATDISERVLTVARAGVYGAGQVRRVPAELRHLLTQDAASGMYRVAPSVRGMVFFARHNLIGSWPMRGPLHVVFCRNVMIYFDRQTQQRLMERFRTLIAPGGCLFIGHSEVLASVDGFEPVQPGVYRRLPLER